MTMNDPYKECSDCPARLPCKIRSGLVKTPNAYTCKPKVFIDRAFKLACIPKAYKNANVYNFIAGEGNSLTKADVKKLVASIYENVMNGINYCITGSTCGTGKTYLACVLMNHFIYKASQTLSPESPVALFVDYAELMDDLRYSDEEGVAVLFNLIKTVPLLVLDDIGSGTMSDYTREQTFIIFNSRSKNELSTIITSNLSSGQLKTEAMLGARVHSRMTQGAIVKEITGKDRRVEGTDYV